MAMYIFLCVSTNFAGKNSWPELVGADGVRAAATIHSENGGVFPVIVPQEAPLPPDFFCSRVWVVVNLANIVVKVPTVG